MGYPIRKLPSGPINRQDTDKILRANNSDMEKLQRAFADNFRGPKSDPNLVRPPRTLAIIWDAGPNGEQNYTNASYWVRTQLPSPWEDTENQTGTADYDKFGIGTDVLDTYDTPDSSLASNWFTATNLYELNPDWGQNGLGGDPEPSDGTHRLPKGMIVVVEAWPDPWNHAKKWYTFERALPIIQAVLTGKDTTPGVYVGNPVIGPPASPPTAGSSTAYVQSQLVTVDPGTTYYFYNRTEAGRSPSEPSQWDLMLAIGLGIVVLVTGTYICKRSDQFLLWAIDSINFKNCTS